MNEANTKISPDLLFHPVNAEIAKGLREGRPFPPSEVSVLIPRWSPEEHMDIYRRVETWLRTEDSAELIALVQEYPSAIGHPCVYSQIMHLWHMVRQRDEEGLPARAQRESDDDPDQPILSSATSAQNMLYKILSVWVPQILPGYALQPPKRDRTRVPNWAMDHRFTILSEFVSLIAALDLVEKSGAAEIAPQRNESRAQFKQRMETVAQRLNARTLAYWATSTDIPATNGAVSKSKRSRLPKTVAATIVRQALQGKRLSKNQLLYGILAYRYAQNCRDTEAIRGLVEHSRGDFPVIDRGKHSHSATR